MCRMQKDAHCPFTKYNSNKFLKHCLAPSSFSLRRNGGAAAWVSLSPKSDGLGHWFSEFQVISGRIDSVLGLCSLLCSCQLPEVWLLPQIKCLQGTVFECSCYHSIIINVYFPVSGMEMIKGKDFPLLFLPPFAFPWQDERDTFINWSHGPSPARCCCLLDFFGCAAVFNCDHTESLSACHRAVRRSAAVEIPA